MQIAPGIHRLGSGIVNSYLVEDAGSVTIVDAGAPTYWGDSRPSWRRWAARSTTSGRSSSPMATAITSASLEAVGASGTSPSRSTRRTPRWLVARFRTRPRASAR